MDINQEILNATNKIIEEKMPEMIEKNVSEMVGKVIGDIFSSYSETAKKIKKVIEEKLDVNLQEFDLIDYNAMVAKVINDSLLQQVNLQPILELTKNTIGFVDKKTIELSEIVEMFKNEAMENSDDNEGEISLHIQVNEHHKWVEVSIDIEPDLNKEDCGISFMYSSNREKIFIFKTKDHWRKQNKITSSRLTALSNLEHKIFRLYSAQVCIKTDATNFDTEWYKEY